jgi:hypothetical protein
VVASFGDRRLHLAINMLGIYLGENRLDARRSMKGARRSCLSPRREEYSFAPQRTRGDLANARVFSGPRHGIWSCNLDHLYSARCMSTLVSVPTEMAGSHSTQGVSTSWKPKTRIPRRRRCPTEALLQQSSADTALYLGSCCDDTSNIPCN